MPLVSEDFSSKHPLASLLHKRLDKLLSNTGRPARFEAEVRTNHTCLHGLGKISCPPDVNLTKRGTRTTEQSCPPRVLHALVWGNESDRRLSFSRVECSWRHGFESEQFERASRQAGEMWLSAEGVKTVMKTSREPRLLSWLAALSRYSGPLRATSGLPPMQTTRADKEIPKKDGSCEWD